MKGRFLAAELGVLLDAGGEGGAGVAGEGLGVLAVAAAPAGEPRFAEEGGGERVVLRGLQAREGERGRGLGAGAGAFADGPAGVEERGADGGSGGVGVELGGLGYAVVEYAGKDPGRP